MTDQSKQTIVLHAFSGMKLVYRLIDRVMFIFSHRQTICTFLQFAILIDYTLLQKKTTKKTMEVIQFAIYKWLFYKKKCN